MGILIIKDGKFFKDGVEQPVEIGNPEQIALLKRYEAIAESLNNEGLEVDIDQEEVIRYTLTAKCICGKNMQTEYEKEPYDTDVEEAMDKTKMKCRTCERKYILGRDNSGDLIYKLDKQ